MMMTNSLKSRIARFARDTRGTATVEFVIVAPMFLALVFSTFEAGWLMTKSMMLERGLDLVVRDIRLGLSANMTPAQFRTEVCNNTKILKNCEQTMMLELVNANVPATIAASSPMCADRTQTIDLDAPSFSQGNRSDILFVRACVIVDPLFPGLGLGLQLPKDASGGFQMIAFSAFVNEPE